MVDDRDRKWAQGECGCGCMMNVCARSCIPPVHGRQWLTEESLLKIDMDCESHGDDPYDEGIRRNPYVVIERRVPEGRRGRVTPL